MEYFRDKIFNDKNKVKELVELFNSDIDNTWLFGKFFLEIYDKYFT